MSDYALVSTLHAARVTLADARKAGDAAAVAAAEDHVAAAAVAVDAALADGRITSATHLLDLDPDSLGAILAHLGPGDTLHAAHTCTKLRSALLCGGLPVPLAAVCQRRWRFYDTAADKETTLRVLDGMEPALGARRLVFGLQAFDEGHARVLARVLDAAPRAARIDITIYAIGLFHEADAGRLADVLSSPDRAFTSPPRVCLRFCVLHDAGTVLRLARGGVFVASIENRERYRQGQHFIEQVAANAADTLTRLRTATSGAFNLPTRFPALRRLELEPAHSENFTTDVPSMTALAPQLKEIRLQSTGGGYHPSMLNGFAYDPPRFARFVAAIDGVTRFCVFNGKSASLYQNENENLRQLAALRTLRDLEISCGWIVHVSLGPRPLGAGRPRAPVAEDVIINLPPLAPGLTRLAFSGVTRVAFGNPLPELRVLDWRGSHAGKIECTTFWQQVNADDDMHDSNCRGGVRVPLAIPSAAIVPNLHTLLIGYRRRHNDTTGEFDLWTLVAAPTALRVVVIEHTRLLCSAPDGFKSMTAGFAAVLARKAKYLVSVHLHDCEHADGHRPVTEHFLRALEQRGVRVCYAGVDECLFCMMHDGNDLWPLDERDPSWWNA